MEEEATRLKTLHTPRVASSLVSPSVIVGILRAASSSPSKYSHYIVIAASAFNALLSCGFHGPADACITCPCLLHSWAMHIKTALPYTQVHGQVKSTNKNRHYVAGGQCSQRFQENSIRFSSEPMRPETSVLSNWNLHSTTVWHAKFLWLYGGGD